MDNICADSLQRENMKLKKRLDRTLRKQEQFEDYLDRSRKLLITANKEITAARMKVIEVENEKNRVITAVAQSLAHDLKNPINLLQLFVDCRSWEAFEQQRPILKSAMLRLTSMVNSFKRADIDGLVRQNWVHISWGKIVDEMNLLASQSGAVISQKNLPTVLLHIDENKLERSLMNLICNAIEAGATNIDIDYEVVGDDINVSVSDNGPGVPNHLLPLLFSKGATFGKSNGMGLGLSFVKQVVEGHGGRVQYGRANGRSIFQMFFPQIVARHCIDEQPEKQIRVDSYAEKNELFSTSDPSRIQITVNLKNRCLENEIVSLISKSFSQVLISRDFNGSAFVWTDCPEMIAKSIKDRVPFQIIDEKDGCERISQIVSEKLQPFF